jgi:hypothetical protein
MKIMAIEREISQDSGVFSAALLRAEARRLWELLQQGIVREAYFNAGSHTAVLMLECQSLSEAELHLASLPLCQEGLITFDLIPLAPYSGFARLFAQKPSP